MVLEPSKRRRVPMLLAVRVANLVAEVLMTGEQVSGAGCLHPAGVRSHSRLMQLLCSIRDICCLWNAPQVQGSGARPVGPKGRHQAASAPSSSALAVQTQPLACAGRVQGAGVPLVGLPADHPGQRPALVQCIPRRARDVLGAALQLDWTICLLRGPAERQSSGTGACRSKMQALQVCCA